MFMQFKTTCWTWVANKFCIQQVEVQTCLNFHATQRPHNNACKRFNNRGDCLIWESWCSIKIPLWWGWLGRHQRYLGWCAVEGSLKIIIMRGKSSSITFHIDDERSYFGRRTLRKVSSVTRPVELKSSAVRFYNMHSSSANPIAWAASPSSLFSASYMAKVYSSSHKAFHGSWREKL